MVDRTYRLCCGPGDFRPARGQRYGGFVRENSYKEISRLRLHPNHRPCFGESPDF